MNPNDIIQQLSLHEARESGMHAIPEALPSNLLNTFQDHYEVKAYTNDARTVWLLVSDAERRFILQVITK